MDIRITYTNGMPELSRKFDIYGLTPIELSVPNGGKNSRLRSLNAYVKTMEFAFTGVCNRAVGAIDELSIGKNWCGVVRKKGDAIDWNLVKGVNDVIIYNMSSTEIQESMYIADNVVVTDKIKPEWSKRLFLPTPDDTKGKIISAIEVFAKYIQNYSLEWKNGLVLKDKNKQIITMDRVKENDVYMLLKLITLILKKSIHLGVFFINAYDFDDSVLQALFEFLKKVYGDAFVFVYHCRSNCSLERELLKLPNLYIREGAPVK